jgi:hypothetical protein
VADLTERSRGLLFQYRELSRLCLDILRRAKGPITLDGIVEQVMEAKGLPGDRRLCKHVTDVFRAGLMRMARKRRVQRVLDQPDASWELAGGKDMGAGEVDGTGRPMFVNFRGSL